MAEDTEKPQSGSLEQQVLADITKSKKESAKAKLKEVMLKKMEAQRTVRLCDEEIAKIVGDFDRGLL